MYPSQVFPTQYSRLQCLLQVTTRYLNFFAVEIILRRQQQTGKTFRQILAGIPKTMPLFILYLRLLYFCYSFRKRQGRTTQIRIQHRMEALLRLLTRQRPQKFSAQMPLCLIRKQISLMAEIRAAISCEKYRRGMSLSFVLRIDFTMYSIPVWMYSLRISIYMYSQK